MKLLEDRIRSEGRVFEGGVLKVDSFLNHQMDVALFRKMAEEWKRLFAGEEITKILTVEASGIAIAAIVAEVFECRALFAKKSKTKNIAGDVYTTRVESFTHGNTYDVIVSKEYLLPTDRVLLIDDFLANGAALTGLCVTVLGSLFNGKAHLSCLIDTNDLDLYFLLLCKMFADIVYICIGYLGNMHHTGTSALNIHESSVLCDSLDLSVVNLTYFQLHKYL